MAKNKKKSAGSGDNGANLTLEDRLSNEITSSGPDDIAAWFIGTDYNEEIFVVRRAYFLGGQDPYKSLKPAWKRRSTGTPGKPSIATNPAPAASRSRPSTTGGMR